MSSILLLHVDLLLCAVLQEQEAHNYMPKAMLMVDLASACINVANLSEIQNGELRIRTHSQSLDLYSVSQPRSSHKVAMLFFDVSVQSEMPR